MKKVIIDVEGIKCGGCESIIEKELNATDGISEAKADHKSGQVRVNFDSAVIELDGLKDIIRKQGYSV